MESLGLGFRFGAWRSFGRRAADSQAEESKGNDGAFNPLSFYPKGPSSIVVGMFLGVLLVGSKCLYEP